MTSATMRGLVCLLGVILLPAGLAQTADASAKRFTFRPIDGQARVTADEPARVVRTVPRKRASAYRTGRPYRTDTPGLISGDRAGARKAVPVTRAKELELNFRPDEREPVYGGIGVGPAGGAMGADHPDFRPTRPRRRPTYEELQAERLPPEPWTGSSSAHPAPVPYPTAPPLPMPPVPTYGVPWPAW